MNDHGNRFFHKLERNLKKTNLNNVDSLKIDKEKAKHCVVTSVGYDIRPWSWIGEDVDLEVLSNQEIIKY